MYSIKLYIGITTSISFALSIWVLLILFMHAVNGAQFLNITPLFLSSACFVASLSYAPLTVIVALTIIYTSR